MKKRVRLAKGYGSFQSAWRTLQGIETMHMINKGRVRWLRVTWSARLTLSPPCSVSPSDTHQIQLLLTPPHRICISKLRNGTA